MKRKKLLWLLGTGLIFAILFSLFKFTVAPVWLGEDSNYGSSSKYSDLLTKDERQWLKSLGSLVYGCDRNAPPLRFVDQVDNQYKGVVVDYINSLSLEMGIEIKLQPLLWQDALSSLSQGKTDMCDMFWSEERAKRYLFSKPIYSLRAVLAVRGDETDINNINNLNGKKIATQQGDYVNEYLNTHYPGVQLLHVEDVNHALEMLKERKVDAVAGDEPVVLYQVAKPEFKNIRVIDEPLYENEVVFGVPKSKPELIPILNKGIDSLSPKGNLEKIQQKWFGISTPLVKVQDVSRLKKYISISMSIAIVFLLLLGIWNQSLKKKVNARTKELQASRNDLQIVFDGITGYMLVVDRNHNIVNVNKSFLEYIGKPKEDIINTNGSSYLNELFDCDDSSIINQTFHKADNREIQVYSKNQVYWIRTYPLIDSQDVVKHVLVVINDITSEKISENQLLQANKMIAIGQLAAGVAHEIRNPLGIIRNHSFILRSSNSLNNEIGKSLDSIDSAVNRASNIIDNLLNFSRMSGNSKEWVNIRRFIDNIIELENKHLQRSHINFEIYCDDSLEIYINQESLKHIIINLISNSIDAISGNGELKITAWVSDEGFWLECADTGCGIRKDDLEKIFNPFHTTKEPGKGTGLGLYIVYNEVRKLGGEILVESEISVGTSFKILVPVNTEVKAV